MGIRESILRSLVQASCTVVKTAFYMYEGKIREKVGIGEKSLLFLSLSNFNQKFLEFCKKFPARWWKLFFTSKDDPSEKEGQISWITHIYFFGNSRVNFTEFGASFMHGCQNCILHVRRNSSRKIWCWWKMFTVFITFEF